MKAIEPPLRKRKVEETDDDDVETCVGFLPKEEWSVVVKNQGYYPSGWTDDDDDLEPVLDPEVYRKIRESDGFDVDTRFPNSYVFTNNDVCRDDMVVICARVGLHWYNFQEGSNLQLVRVEKYNSRFCSIMHYQITVEAMDPATDSRLTFQTSVTDAPCKYDEELRIQTDVKPKIQGTGEKIERWNYEAIHDLYKGNLPELISDHKQHDQFYELQESEIRENDWLNLYTEIAWGADMMIWHESCVPLEITKVVVLTYENVKGKGKLKAGNAIFYISFKDFNAPQGPPQDHRAIVRRTVDGITGHVCLESKCLPEDL